MLTRPVDIKHNIILLFFERQYTQNIPSEYKQNKTKETKWFEIFVKQNNVSTLSAMDVLAPTTMKNAAKCDT